MSCKPTFSEEFWKTIQHDIAHRRCPKCASGPLVGGDAPMVFEKSLLSTWTCEHCGEEIAFVISETGEVYRT